jgi:hypothetical protein
MKHDFAVKLVQDELFAHMWLCHRDGSECPDGCDTHGDCTRVAMYQGIQVYHIEREVRAYNRGVEDARTYKAPLFRQTRDQGIRSEMDDHMSDMWDDGMRQAYLDGYNSTHWHQPRRK